MAKKAKTFVLSDESVNSYGFRILTDGIDLSLFKKNPIMLWNHSRSWSDSNNTILPIGKWENIRIEEGVLKADAVFDEDDAFAASIARKVEKGIINMCSVCVEMLEESEKPEHVVQGQTRRTVTKSRLLEASVADIGSNYNSLSLCKDGKMIELKTGDDCPVGLLKECQLNNKSINENNLKMKVIAMSLGLAESATEAQIVAAIGDLKKLNDVISEKDKTIEALQNEAKEKEKKAIKDAVNLAVSAKKITADKAAHFIELGEAVGLEKLQKTLDSVEPVVKPSQFLNQSSGAGSSGGGVKKYSELSSEELIHLRENDRDGYIDLYKAEFGFEPKMD
jgi:hypothetical protein